MVGIWLFLRIFFIIVGAWAVLFVIYYFIVPVLLLASFLNKHYAGFKVEDSSSYIYGAKFKKSEPMVFYQLEHPPKEVKTKNYGYYMLDRHKEAYNKLLAIREKAAEEEKHAK